MPQRLLRPGLKDSVAWNACDFPTQSCYIRLLNVVDDYGRYEADPDLLKGHCFAKRHDIDVRAIVSMCQQLSANKLAIFYRDQEKAYLQLLRWKERARAESRFPAPNADICQQLTAIDNKCLLPSPSPSPSPSCVYTRAENGKPADLPEANTPTLKEVLEYAGVQGISKASAESFWHHHEDNSLWANQYGRAVNWKAKVKTWAETDRQAPPRARPGRSAPPETKSPAERELERLAQDPCRGL